MITAVVTVRAKTGRGQELIDGFMSHAKLVKANEPGTKLYTLNRSREDADLFYAVEMYDDEAAMQAHIANFQNAGGGATDVFAGPPEIMLLDRLV